MLAKGGAFCPISPALVYLTLVPLLHGRAIGSPVGLMTAEPRGASTIHSEEAFLWG